MTLTDLAILGHLGSDELAGAATANIWMAASSVWVLRGLAAAAGVLTAQAHGSGNPHLITVWFRLGVYLCVLSLLPVALAWWFTEDVLHALGSSSTTARLAGRFARYSLLSLYTNALNVIVGASLRSQQIVRPTLVVSLVFLFVNLGLNVLLVHGVAGVGGLGFVGSPIATAISRTGLLLCLVLYVWWAELCSQSWPSWSDWFSFEELTKPRVKEYVGLAVPLLIGGSLEEWQLQAVAFLASSLGDVQISTHTSVLYMFFFLTSMLYGIESAASSRVGYFLGAGDPVSAKATAKLSLTHVAFPTGVVVGGVIMACHAYVGRIFSNDPDVWHEASDILWLVGGGYALMSIFYICMGVLDAQARPGVVAVSFFIGAWCVTLPLSYSLAYPVDMGLFGIWLGMVAGYFTITAIAGVAVLRSDWDDASRQAVRRSEKRNTHLPGSINSPQPPRRGAPGTDAVLSPLL